MNKKTIEIPLEKASYVELQEVICELQVERLAKDNEIEVLQEQVNYWKTEHSLLSYKYKELLKKNRKLKEVKK